MSEYGVDWEHRVDYENLRKKRIERLRGLMKEQNVDAVLVFRPENVRYITSLRPSWGDFLGYTTRYAGLLTREQGPVLFVDQREHSRCAGGMPWIDTRNIRPLGPLEYPGMPQQIGRDTFKKAFEELDVSGGRIAIDALSFELLVSFEKELPRARLVDGDYFMKRVKIVKNEEEIKLLRIAAMIADTGITAAMNAITVGRRECELLGLALRKMQSLGMERPQANLIFATGERTAPLHRMATDKTLRNGDFVFMDMGGCFNGYFSDESRTEIVGRASEKQKSIYHAVYDALQTAIGKLTPGTRTSDINVAARSVIKESGYEKYGYYGLLGHGIGISGQEAPLVGEIVTAGENEVRLEAGMAFTLEPGIYVPGVGGVRLEDNVVITEGKPEILTRVPYCERLLS